MATRKVAKTAEEFREKYENMRFTSPTVAKSLILNYVYQGLQVNEGTPVEERKSLFELSDLAPIIKNERDSQLVNVYYHFVEWLGVAFENTVFVRNSIVESLRSLYFAVASIVDAENLRRAIGDKAKEPDVWLWLNQLTIEGYLEQKDEHWYIVRLRRIIDNDLRYVEAYNTLISIIAKAVGVPELTFYAVDIKQITANIMKVNEALKTLREDIALHRTAEVAPDTEAGEVLGDIVKFTPDYLRSSMKAFDDLSDKPSEPIPEENIASTTAFINDEIIGNRQLLWNRVMRRITADYWRRFIK